MLCSGNTVLQGCSILPSLIGGACACLGRHFQHRCQLLNFQCQAVSRLCDCCPNLTPVDHIIYQPILETNWDKGSMYKARLASVQKYGQMPLSVQCAALMTMACNCTCMALIGCRFRRRSSLFSGQEGMRRWYTAGEPLQHTSALSRVRGNTHAGSCRCVAYNAIQELPRS